MIFKFMVLDLERRKDQFSNEAGYSFYLKSRSLCGYLEGYMYPLKIKTDDYNQLGIKGVKKVEYPTYINSCQTLIVYLDFDLEIYSNILKTKSTKLINEYFIDFIMAGLEKVDSNFGLPKTKITEGIESFRKNGYINKWILIKRRIIKTSLSCYLECQVTLDYFSIELVILDKCDEIKRVEIIREIPNPMIYDNHIGTMKVTKEGEIQISDSSKKILYNKAITEII